jgi:hypothetical protein
MLGPMVVASVIVLCAGQPAGAQTDWTWDQIVVSPGDPGSWDSGRHIMGDVVFDGATYHMYLVGGWGSNPIDDSWSVGHWTWNDVDLEWEQDPANPVLSPGAAGAWDAYSIGSVAVLYDGGTFHMWYCSGAVHLAPVHVGYATSADGSVWTKHAGNPVAGLGPGAPGAWDDHGTAPHTVLVEGSSLRVWYFAFQGGYWYHSWRIGHARSTDGGLSWDKDPIPVLEGTEPWEGNNVYYPTVVRYGDRFAMWYTAFVAGVEAAIGHATSSDGLVWTKWPGNPVLTPLPGCDVVDSSEVILQGDTAHGWVSNCDDVWHVTSDLELFFGNFETGDTGLWSAAVP